MYESSTHQRDYLRLQSLDQCLHESHKSPLLIFKHSAICSASHFAKHQVDDYLKESTLPIYLIVVQQDRPLSNLIAKQLQIRHESPQLLILHHGQVKAALSHYEVTRENILAALAD